MISVKFTVDKPGVVEALAASSQAAQDKAEMLLASVGIETIAYLRSFTSESRPPARKGEGPRPAHPGHWADVRGQLALSYGYRVERIGTVSRLVLFNDAEHAIYLEHMEGYFVLQGVTDPGGPVVEAVRRAAALLGGFEVLL